MERLERRAIGRVAFPSKGVIVVCDTQEILHVCVRDLGPIEIGIRADADTPNIVGKDVIVVAETLIMYADVVRQESMVDGCWSIGLSARKFTVDVLQYLYDGIALKANTEEVMKDE